MKYATIIVEVDCDGMLNVRGLYADELLQKCFGSTRRVRASHVEPTSFLKRLAFHALRKLSARFVPWTRTWRGPWRVRIASTNRVLPGTWAVRGDAIKAEVAFLEANDLP